MDLLKILIISTLTFFIGSAITFGLTNGLEGVIMSPFLSIFGWYFWVIIFAAVLGLWQLYNPAKNAVLYRMAFLVGSTGLGLGTWYFFFSQSWGADLGEAIRLSSALCGGLAGLMIIKTKK